MHFLGFAGHQGRFSKVVQPADRPGPESFLVAFSEFSGWVSEFNPLNVIHF